LKAKSPSPLIGGLDGEENLKKSGLL